MAVMNLTQISWDELTFSQAKIVSYIVTACLAFIFILSFHNAPKPTSTFLNPKQTFEVTESRSRKQFVFSFRSLVREWFSANPNKPACLISDFGPLTVLPPFMANEVRNDRRLSFTKFSYNFFLTTIPGFQAFNEGTKDSITLTVINKDLTKYLAKVTEPLAEEMTLAMNDYLPKVDEWYSVTLRESMLHIIARISSRVFLGEELCRNEEWLKITTSYTSNAFPTLDILRTWPKALRPIVHWFLPGCQTARAQIKEAASIIGPVIEKRRAAKAAALAAGEKPPQFNDSIDWFEKASQSKATPYDPAISQLFLSTVAIHTTADLLCQTMIDIALNPEIFEPLREEVKGVIEAGGWKKTSLHDMRLLDSVIKESQRMKPLQLGGTYARLAASMQRMATQDITLSDGTFIPKGTYSCVSSHNLWNPNVYENPEKWNGYRFFHERQISGKENTSQLVSTSENHLGFGHGLHACPGRFFAANEIKIALAHLLLEYEWRLTEGEEPSISDFGLSPLMKQDLKMDIRRVVN